MNPRSRQNTLGGGDATGELTITLHRGETREQSVREVLVWVTENVVGFFFEFLLAASLAFEILFASTFGWGTVLPFLAVSLANLVLWLFYLRHLFHRD